MPEPSASHLLVREGDADVPGLETRSVDHVKAQRTLLLHCAVLGREGREKGVQSLQSHFGIIKNTQTVWYSFYAFTIYIINLAYIQLKI